MEPRKSKRLKEAKGLKMEFKIEKKKNSVELRFRKDIYSEESIGEALRAIKKNLKAKKSRDKEYFVVSLVPPEKACLEELAWEFCNLVIAARKGSTF